MPGQRPLRWLQGTTWAAGRPQSRRRHLGLAHLTRPPSEAVGRFRPNRPRRSLGGVRPREGRLGPVAAGRGQSSHWLAPRPWQLGLLYFGQIADRLATSPAAQGTHYTALYFTDPAPLSATLSVREPSQLSFTVFNHEGRQRVYQYVVTLAGPHGSSVVQRGSISLKEDTGAVTVVNLGPTGRRGAYLITVTITDPPQSIHTEGYL